MFSMIFFLFVAVIAVVGLLAATWRRRNKIPLDNDVVDRDGEHLSRSSSAFNEAPTDKIKGGIVPTENKLSQKDFDDENKVTD